MRLRTIAAVAICTAVGYAQPANNDCNYATPITLPATIAGTNIGANTQWTGCAIGSDVFYRLTAPYNGTLTATVCNALGGSSDFDTVIVIRPGPCGSLILACNDDYCGNQSWVQLAMTTGTEYDIQVGGWNGAQGNFTLKVTGTPNPVPNDSCATATPITVGNVAIGENWGATTGPDPQPWPCNSWFDVWYVFTAPACGTYVASTCTGWTNFDTVLGIWQGTCGALTQVVCNDDSCPSGWATASNATFYADAGSTRTISLGGFGGGNFGQYGLTVNPVANTAMDLTFSNSGPGTLGFSITNGPSGGYAFTAFTANQGGFPNGWFSGIDISMPDIIGQWMSGPPFVVGLSTPCGNVTMGPFSGLPSGLTVYSVAHGFTAGSVIPSVHSPARVATIP